MRCVTVVVQSLTALTAFIAAFRWYKASTLATPDFSIIATFLLSEEGTAPIGQWAQTSAKLNKSAAFWAGASAVLAAIGTVTVLL
jgi:hypothetical protein